MDDTLRKSWNIDSAGVDWKRGLASDSNWVALGNLWRRWTDWVKWFATHEPGRLATTGQAYESLHSQLLQTCRALLADADLIQRQRLDMMHDLAKPWLTASCLDHADREILGDLWRRCRQVDLEINGPDRRVVWRRLRAGLILVLGSLALTAVILLTADVVLDPFLELLENGWRSARILWKRTTAVEWWQGIGGACLVVAAIVLLRAIRR